MGVMIYFRHILMGHEIFFKVFDGPQNILLCSIFVFLSFKLMELEHKTSKLAIKSSSRFKKDMLNKSHLLRRYKANSGENKKKMFDAFWSWCLGLCPEQLTQDTILWQIFFSNLYLFDSVFSIVVWTNRLHDFDEGICFHDKCCYDNG